VPGDQGPLGLVLDATDHRIVCVEHLPLHFQDDTSDSAQPRDRLPPLLWPRDTRAHLNDSAFQRPASKSERISDLVGGSQSGVEWSAFFRDRLIRMTTASPANTVSTPTITSS
jgi:hypothetical protein